MANWFWSWLRRYGLTFLLCVCVGIAAMDLVEAPAPSSVNQLIGRWLVWGALISYPSFVLRLIWEWD